MVINKGNFFTELERLKGLDNHRQKLETILSRDPRSNIKRTVDRYDPTKNAEEKLKRNAYHNLSKFISY